MAQSSAYDLPGQVHAILGPTNTGKTHVAIERMLAHPTGMIGLPLRLLAREVFDRVCALVDPNQVALVTGEERIASRDSRYWICTVEAMPVSRPVDFVAIDEVQLAADRDRGHVFTDRLLWARGRRETVFLGAETIAPLLLKLIPGAKVEIRARLSGLTYLGSRKLSRLPRRTAVIAYRAEELYGVADFLRRHKGGAAVVMGALSPRTRNAQVAMFEGGEVDYLVATDAIGMGLNLTIDHVAFASLQKFDGTLVRRLAPHEVGQVAGRAGRFLSPGTFGTTGDAPLLDEDTIAAVESHRYRNLGRLRYRNSQLDLSSVPGLITSLDAPPRLDFLIAAPEADDIRALRKLYGEPDIARSAKSPGNVPLLWRVCGIPDFQQILHESHVNLLGRIYRLLLAGSGKLPDDFLAAYIHALDRIQGDIDTLQTRLAHVRTWTYVAHQADWLNDPGYWQQTAQSVEERLSEALHQRLTQRFVDRQHAATLRRLQESGDLAVSIDDDGVVRIAEEEVGAIRGLRFSRQSGARSDVGKTLRRLLRAELEDRAFRLMESGAADLELRNGTVRWQREVVARLHPGEAIDRPQLRLVVDSAFLDSTTVQSLAAYLRDWLDTFLEGRLRPLRDLARPDLSPAGRGLVFRLQETLGAIAINSAHDPVGALSAGDRQVLTRAGVRFGRHFVFLPTMLKPARATIADELRGAFTGARPVAVPSGRVSVEIPRDAPASTSPGGYLRIGRRWFRIDALERLADLLASESAPVRIRPDMLSLVGCPRADVGDLMKFLRYRRAGASPEIYLPAAGRRRSPAARLRKQSAGTTSPFAVLETLLERTQS